MKTPETYAIVAGTQIIKAFCVLGKQMKFDISSM